MKKVKVRDKEFSLFLTAEDIDHEVCSGGFVRRDKVCGKLSHDNTLVSGCVWNFTKKEKVR